MLFVSFIHHLYIFNCLIIACALTIADNIIDNVTLIAYRISDMI